MASYLKSSSSGIMRCCILVTMVTSALACMCQPSHPQQQYCKANFVLTGHVLEKNPIDDIQLRGRFGQFEYVINVDKIFKENENLKKGASGFPLSILTSPGDSLCGPKSLKIGTKYLIAGSVVDGELHISACDWIQEWRDVTQQQKKGIKNFYSAYCSQCTIQSTMGGFRQTGGGAAGGCIYDPAPSMVNGVEDCQALYATCIIQQGQACQWYHRGNDYQDCINRNKPYYHGVETTQSVNFPIMDDVMT
ncbi:metalloproteinase inhibitor 1 [Strongylocentrotus purpuratus]|uniref:NTR domain-containing protein n=1 Tax=Strongylocentrotus purpuratus TaxID=7668 RepID=A0A7M7RC29_STRPU|nr:metalloproteinase inhibitor 1 [Strongylocentrotus purpuratus]|eukprot:XP_780837.2 PREDICTED: metalloproteinase inhibitor 1 [Strongylocentrotus purpuratus]